MSELPTTPAAHEAWLADALRLHQAGRIAEAIHAYERALACEPHQPEALNNLATLLKQQGRLVEAAQRLVQALEINPKVVDAWFNLGNTLVAAGDPRAALDAYRHALALAPADADLHFHHAGALVQANLLPEAIEALRSVVRLAPGHAIAHQSLARLCQALDRPAEAIAAWRGFAALQPGNVEARTQLGLLLHAQREFEDAAQAWQAALKLKPDDAALWNRLGVSLQKLGRSVDAASCYAQSLSLDAGNAEPHSNWAGLLNQLGRSAEAAKHGQRAIELRPDFPEAHNNLGVTCAHQGQHDLAIQHFERALTLAPGFGEAAKNLGENWAMQGHLENALAAWQRAIRSNSRAAAGCRVKAALLLPRIAESRDQLIGVRQRLAAELDCLARMDLRLADPMTEVGQNNFWLAYHFENDRELQQRIARFYLQACPALNWTAPQCRQPAPREPGRRLRLGIASAWLHNHTIGKLQRGLIEQLDRARFEVILLRFPGPRDAMAEAMDRAADRVVGLPAGLWAARRQIADTALDVLLYPEIGMDALTYYVAFARLAPVQCVTWGHPDTTGLPHMDYFLSSAELEPDGSEPQYSERLVQLKEFPIHIHRPELKMPPPTREQLGLPRAGRLYVCPQSLFKLHPDFDPVLGEILHRDPQGWLVLLSGAVPRWDALLRARLARAFPQEVERVIFLRRLPEPEFLHLCAMADALLDPPHFSGGNSSLEALALGAPIVTWPGPFLRARITFACCRKMGVCDCVADNAADYVALALRLANDAAWRQAVSQRITERNSVLFHNTAAVRELEEFLLSASATALPATR